MPNPDLFLDSHPDAQVEPSRDWSDLPLAEEAMDLRVAHAHSAPNIEMLSLFVAPGRGFSALDYDASRIKVSLWTPNDVKSPAVLVSTQDISGLVADLTTATLGSAFTSPRTGPYVSLAQLSSVGGGALIISTQAEIWLYAIPSAAGDGSSAQVNLLVERYASA